MKKKPNLEEAALETAQRLVDYESYQGRESKALAALKRKCPGYETDDYTTWFNRALVAHKDAIKYVEDNSDLFWAAFDARKSEEFSIEGLADQFIQCHPEFSASALHHQLCFVFYLYHLR